MPEPGQQYGYAPGPPAHQGSMPPPRRGSIPPLNTNFIRTDDASPHGMSFGTPNPIPPRSGIPYPGQSGNPNGPLRPSTASGYGHQPRPLSGFPIANRPFSIATGGSGMIPPAGTYPPRAGTAMGSMGGSAPNGPDGQYRRPSGPGRQQYPGPQGFQPNPMIPDGQYGAPPGNDGKHRPPPVDIGFEAPNQRPLRSPASRPPRSPAPQGTMSSGHGMRLPGGEMSGQRLPIGNGPPTPMTPGPNMKPMGLPASPAQMAGAWPPPQQQGSPTPSQHQQYGAPPEPVSTPKPSTPKPAPPAKPGKAGKGPKTFEEMGVGHIKEEQDCVGVPFESRSDTVTDGETVHYVRRITDGDKKKGWRDIWVWFVMLEGARGRNRHFFIAISNVSACMRVGGYQTGLLEFGVLYGLGFVPVGIVIGRFSSRSVLDSYVLIFLWDVCSE